jgi:hypothetical protein
MEEKNWDDLVSQLPEDSPKTAKFRNQYEVRFELTNNLSLLGVEFTRIIGLNFYKDVMINELLSVELRKQCKDLISDRDNLRINSFVRIVDDILITHLNDKKDSLVL